MRRKSSAQTLLSSFKSPSNVPTTAPATQLTMQIPAALNSGLSSYPGAGHGGTTGTPISTTQREWDTQSMKSDSTAPGNQINGSPAMPQSVSLESLRDITMKRMITLTYLRNIHEGCVASCSLSGMTLTRISCRRSHWFNTVKMSRELLDKEFNNEKMKKRFVLPRCLFLCWRTHIIEQEHYRLQFSACHCL
jgi:hypothetical protein